LDAIIVVVIALAGRLQLNVLSAADDD